MPEVRRPVGRRDMVAPLGWTSFVCPACNTQLDATRITQAIIMLAAAMAAVLVAWGLELLGGLPSIVGGGVALLLGSYLGLGRFARLSVHTTEHPSVVP